MSAAAGGLFVVAYGIMTGLSGATFRAVVMLLVQVGADVAGRKYDGFSAISLALLVMLVNNPYQITQAGFLLSFGAVLGICLVYPILESAIHPKRKLSRTILFSISLALITYPLSVHFFYEYPLYSILLNFIVIPCMPIVMGFGGAGMLAGCAVTEIGRVIGIPAHLVLSLYEGLGTWVAALPASVLRLGCEEPWQLILYYVVLFVSLLGLWYGRRKIFGLLLPVAVLIVTLRFRKGLEFTMLDVGQGDGLFLRMPCGTTCLIDGGSTSVKNIGQYRILPYLKYEGVSKLDYVIFTHLDEDHISGIRELVEMYGTLDGVKIDQILFPAIADPDENYVEMWNLAKEKGIVTGTIGAGDTIHGENCMLECI